MRTTMDDQTKYTDVFLRPVDSDWVGLIVFAVFALFLGILALARAQERKTRQRTTRIVGVLLILCAVGSVWLFSIVATTVNQQAADAMKSSVANSYDLELEDSPLLTSDATRTQPTLSTFRTAGGETVELLLSFESETGRAIVTDIADSTYAK